MDLLQTLIDSIVKLLNDSKLDLSLQEELAKHVMRVLVNLVESLYEYKPKKLIESLLDRVNLFKMLSRHLLKH